MKKLVFLILVSFIALSSLQAANWMENTEVDSTDITTTYTEPLTAKHKIKEVDNIVFPRLRFAVYGGLSGHQNNNSSPFSDYNYDLRSGKNLGLDLQYYIFKPIGVGIRYGAFHAKSLIPTGSNLIEADLSIKFAGPIVSGRYLHSNDKNAVFFNMGYGYVDYQLYYTDGIDLIIKGNTFASVFNLGYELGITQRFGILVQTSYLSGNLKKFEGSYANFKETVNLEREDYESLNRIDFSVGLRFNL